jgi:adenylylsulfate kinase
VRRSRVPEADRVENIRRIGELAKLFVEAGTIVLTAFVSPYRRDREHARGLLLHGDFLEIWCRCPVEICERRDPKGHYQRAREGKLKDFTGVSAPYEEPREPELVLDTDRLSIEESVGKALALLRDRGILPAA